MRFSKLITTLSTFDKTETKRFEAFLQSPYFEVSDPACALHHYLKKLHYKLPAKQLEPDAIAAKEPLLKLKSTQDKAGTALLKTIEHFIAVEQWQKNDSEKMLAALKGYKEKHLFDLCKATQQNLEQLLEKNTLQDIDIFYQRHLLTEICLTGFDARQKRSATDSVLPVITTLDAFYAIKKLRYLCETLNRKEIFGSYHSDEGVAHLLAILQPHTSEKYPYVWLFVNGWQMLTAASYPAGETYYRLIKQYVSKQKKGNPSPEVKEIADYCIAWSIQWGNRGHLSASKEYVWWSEWKIKHGLFLQKGKLQPITFRNVVNLARASSYPAAWIKNFIDRYHLHLPPEKRESNLHFAMGLYYYMLKNYSEAGFHFSQAEDENEPFLNCVLKRWGYMCAVDSRDNTDGLYAMLNTFRKYINRHAEQLVHFKPMYSLFLSYSEKLLKAADGEAKEKIAARLYEEEFFPGKDWLLGQLIKEHGAKNGNVTASAPVPAGFK